MKKLLLGTMIFGALSTEVMAAQTKNVVASFDITPCSRTTSYRDSFGITWPTIQFARQSTDLVVTVGHAPDFSYESFNAANNECQGLAIAAAGITFVVNPAAFAAAYEGTYSACMYARLGGEISGIGVAVESTCHW